MTDPGEFGQSDDAAKSLAGVGATDDNPACVVVTGKEFSNKGRFVSLLLGTGVGLDPSLPGFTKKVITDRGATHAELFVTSGQESLYGALDKLHRAAHGFIFVYNINDSSTLDWCAELKEKLTRYLPKAVPMSLVGFHCVDDTEHSKREVKIEDGEKFAVNYGFSFCETTSENKQQIDEVLDDLVQKIVAPNKDNVKVSSENREFEIFVGGDTFTGKTAIVDRLMDNNPSLAYRTTNTPTMKRYALSHGGDHKLLKIWDLPGFTPKGPWLTKEFLLTMQAGVLVYSVAAFASFAEIPKLIALLRERKQEKIPLILVANMCDKEETRQVTTKQGEDMARQYGLTFYEVSAMRAGSQLKEPFAAAVKDIVEKKDTSKPGFAMPPLDIKGYLGKLKGNRKTCQQRFFAIQNGTLFYAKDAAGIDKPSRKVLCTLHKVEIKSAEIDPRWGAHFEVIGEKQHHLYAATPEEREEWVQSARANVIVNDTVFSTLDEGLRAVLHDVVTAVQAGDFSTSTPAKPRPDLKKSKSDSSLPHMNSQGQMEPAKKKSGGFFGFGKKKAK